jgi:hypothetical protein
MEKKLLPYLVVISALSVSLSAAFYSVTGLGKMFSGASVQVMIMMSSLEIAHDRNIFGGRITRECTFIITDQKYDYLALHIIKYMRKKKPSWEIEVEIKKPSTISEPKK